ncbi:MAG TPA: hypothetical protein VG756_25975, partial [Pseudonocardiaceae bacterium]|nr:hypothetical protein [Pseudonocardiaceae bacterium]
DDESGITALTRGDAAGARELRANLAVFARQTDTPEVRRLVAEVLAGRRNVREVFASREFNEVGLRHVANVERGLAQLTEEQRAELFNPDRPPTPEDKLDALRDGVSISEGTPVAPPSGVPAPERRVVDEDDEDFSAQTYTERVN